MRPYLAESRLLARPDKSCQRLEESACLLKNEGHGAAGVTTGLTRQLLSNQLKYEVQPAPFLKKKCKFFNLRVLPSAHSSKHFHCICGSTSCHTERRYSDAAGNLRQNPPFVPCREKSYTTYLDHSVSVTYRKSITSVIHHAEIGQTFAGSSLLNAKIECFCGELITSWFWSPVDRTSSLNKSLGKS